MMDKKMMRCLLGLILVGSGKLCCFAGRVYMIAGRNQQDEWVKYYNEQYLVLKYTSGHHTKPIVFTAVETQAGVRSWRLLNKKDEAQNIYHQLVSEYNERVVANGNGINQ